jgi:hypothetical protein
MCEANVGFGDDEEPNNRMNHMIHAGAASAESHLSWTLGRANMRDWVKHNWIIIPLSVLLLFVAYAIADTLILRHEIYKEAKVRSKYSTEWPITPAEYDEMKRAVLVQCPDGSVISNVFVQSNTRIQLTVLHHWYGRLSSSWATYVFEKIGGSWSIVSVGSGCT